MILKMGLSTQVGGKLKNMSNMPSYSLWYKRYRFYTDQGIDCLIAWHKTNKHFEIGETEWKKFESDSGNKLDEIGKES